MDFRNARNGVSISFTPRFAAGVPDHARHLLGTKNDKGEYVRELAGPGDDTWKGKVESALADAAKPVMAA